jgi:hypothetical protein
MSTNEVRALKLRDVNLPAQVLTISSEGSKNRYRQRTIPLREPQTLWATFPSSTLSHELAEALVLEHLCDDRAICRINGCVHDYLAAIDIAVLTNANHFIGA